MSNLLFDQIHKKFSALSVASIISTSALVVTPVSAQAETVKIFTATTFNFKGCTKSSNGLDIICVGSFRNRDADQNIRISRTGNYGNTFITDTNGESSVADEIQIGSRSCRSKCGSELVTLVEGAEYKISFIFKDVTLPSSKIALFQISYYYGGSYNMKFRKVSVSGNKVSTDRSEINNFSSTDREELQNAANEVEKQEQDRIAAAQAEQDKKDREAALRRAQNTTTKKKPKPQQQDWLSQQLNQGILDLFGKPKKPKK